MVFGWGKKKKAYVEEPKIDHSQISSKTVSLDEIPEILENVVAIRKKTLSSEIKSHRNQIDPERELLIKIANDFERDNRNDDQIDPHLQVIIKRGKREIMSCIKNELTNPFPEVNSFDDAIQFQKITSSRIKKVGDMLGKHSRAIHIFASKYAKKLKEDLGELTENLKHVDELIENFVNTENQIELINELISKREKTLEEILKREKRKNELLKSLEEKNEQISSLKNTIENIRQSSEYKSHIDIKTKFEEINFEQQKIRKRINDEFTKVSRPLGKFVHMTSHDKELKHLTEQLSSSPFDILNSENLSGIKTVFSSIITGIDSGSVSVKDVSKAKQSILEVEEILPSLISQKDDFFSKKHSLEENLKNFDLTPLVNAESALKREENNVNDILSKIKIFEDETLELTNSLPKLLSQIETNLKEVTAISYTITLDIK